MKITSKNLLYLMIPLLLFSYGKIYGKGLPSGVQSVKTVHSLRKPNKIEVAEFLWLGCPHCKDFHPSWVRLKKEFAGQVEFVSHPVAFPKWKFDSRVFLALDEMGLLNDGLLANYYEARQSLSGLERDINKVTDWLQQRYDVKPASFIAVFENAPLIDQKYEEAEQFLENYPINGSPTVLISVPASGQTYLVSTPTGTMEQKIRSLLQENIKS